MNFLLAVMIATCGLQASIAQAQDTEQGSVTSGTPERPTILPDRRWQEDWSVLADPRVQHEPLDKLKYIALSPNDANIYVSLGLDLRVRVEANHAAQFGTRPGLAGEWVLNRLEWHADLRLGPHVQVFTQLQSAFAPGKDILTPVDQDRLDVEQAFIGLTESIGGGRMILRLGG